MDTIAIVEESSAVNWHYDREADVLYLSLGEPRPALGVDIGDGIIVRYDEDEKSLVGLTLVGVRHRLLKELVAQ
jgi:uncharacterized protein YuzE